MFEIFNETFKLFLHNNFRLPVSIRIRQYETKKVGQTSFLNICPWQTSFVLWLKCHWRFFCWLNRQWVNHGLGHGLVPKVQQAITWTNDDFVDCDHMASVGRNSLQFTCNLLIIVIFITKPSYLTKCSLLTRYQICMLFQWFRHGKQIWT